MTHNNLCDEQWRSPHTEGILEMEDFVMLRALTCYPSVTNRCSSWKISFIPAMTLAVATLNLSCSSHSETGRQYGDLYANPVAMAAQQPATPSSVARVFIQELVSKNVSGARDRMSLAARETMQTNIGPAATGHALPALAEMLSQCAGSQVEVSPAAGPDIRPDIGTPMLVTFVPKCGDRRAAIFALFPTWCCPPERGPLTSCLVRTQMVNDQLKVTSVGCS